MALFNFGKKKEENKKPACCCANGGTVNNDCCSAPADGAEKNVCCGEAVDGICCIKVLGAGCKACHQQYEYARAAAASLGIAAGVEYITDMEQVMAYGVMSMPAVVVNEKVVSSGKILKEADVVKLLKTFGA